MRAVWVCVATALAAAAGCATEACDGSLMGMAASQLPLEGSPVPPEKGPNPWGWNVGDDLPFFTCRFRCAYQTDAADFCASCTGETVATPFRLGGAYRGVGPGCSAFGEQVCTIWARDDRVVGVNLKCVYGAEG
jgi:hypothetical protein